MIQQSTKKTESVFNVHRNSVFKKYIFVPISIFFILLVLPICHKSATSRIFNYFINQFEKLSEMERVEEDQQGLEETRQKPLTTLEMLPEVAWKKIFDKMNEPTMLTCFNIDATWRRILMPKRSVLFFPEVAPFLLLKLEKSDILKLREVCNSWKKAVDHTIQTKGSNVNSEVLDILTLGYRTLVAPVQTILNFFNSTENIEKFLCDMEFHGGNPFPGRKVGFQWGYDETEYEDDETEEYKASQKLLFDEFWSTVSRLLDVFGQQIYFAEIDFHHGERIGSLFDPEPMLRNCLMRMPNVKRLHIKWNYTHVTTGEMPQLENLESLVLAIFSNASLASIAESCCVSHKMKLLEYKNVLPPIYELWDAFCAFSNLETLITYLDIEELERFKSLAQPPPLRKLVLRICTRVGGRLDASRVFDALEVFADSLVDVALSPRLEYIHVNNINACRINLRKLERFTILDYNGTLDTMLNLTSLRYLHVQFEGLTNKPYWRSRVEKRVRRCRILELIPTLDELKITCNRPDNRIPNDTLFHFCRKHQKKITGASDSIDQN